MRAVALAAICLLLCGCSQQSAQAPAHTPAPSPSLRQTHPLPSPSAHPSYPPRDLADVAGLAAEAKPRRFIGMEDQPLDNCDRAWMRVLIPDGTPPREAAADLIHAAIQHYGLFSSCGAFVYGTANTAYCNCYHGENGMLSIERGPAYEPAPGMMRLTFSVRETVSSPGDWSVVMVAPDR
jgi:hypothetical protein